MTSSKRQKIKVLIFGAVSILIFLIYAVIKNIAFETNWRYEKYNGGYRLISYTQAYNDDTREIVIPSEYNGLDVVAIDDKAFYNNKKILKVTIPDTVTELGASVFKDCKNLNEIRFGENITTIGGECFITVLFKSVFPCRAKRHERLEFIPHHNLCNSASENNWDITNFTRSKVNVVQTDI